MLKIPVCLSFDDNYAAFGCTVIKSVLDNARGEDDYVFYILHEVLSDKVKSKIKECASSHNNCEIKFIDVSAVFDNIKLYHHTIYNRNTYFRLAICDILPDETKIIYLDSDIVVNNNLATLYQFDMKEALIGAAQDVFIHCLLETHGLTNGAVGTTSIRKYLQAELGLCPTDKYYQAGILLMDLQKIRATDLPKATIQLAGSKNYWMQDQDIINKVYKGKIIELPQVWNVLSGDGYYESFMSKIETPLVDEYKYARQSPYIVHFAGKAKPWIYYDIDYSNLFWDNFRKTPWAKNIFTYLIDGNLKSIATLPYTKSWNSIFKLIIEKILPKGSLRRDTLIILSRKFGIGNV